MGMFTSPQLTVYTQTSLVSIQINELSSSLCVFSPANLTLKMTISFYELLHRVLVHAGTYLFSLLVQDDSLVLGHSARLATRADAQGTGLSDS